MIPGASGHILNLKSREFAVVKHVKKNLVPFWKVSYGSKAGFDSEPSNPPALYCIFTCRLRIDVSDSDVRYRSMMFDVLDKMSTLLLLLLALLRVSLLITSGGS